MIFFVIVVVLLLLMLIGVPVAISMGMTAITSLILQGKAGVLTMAAQRMFSGATGFTSAGSSLLHLGRTAHDIPVELRSEFSDLRGQSLAIGGGG